MSDDPLTEDVLRKLDELIAAATPEPWYAFVEEREPIGGCSFIQLAADGYSPPDMYVYHDQELAPAADLDFIAAARKYLPLLVEEVRRLRADQSE